LVRVSLVHPWYLDLVAQQGLQNLLLLVDQLLLQVLGHLGYHPVPGVPVVQEILKVQVVLGCLYLLAVQVVQHSQAVLVDPMVLWVLVVQVDHFVLVFLVYLSPQPVQEFLGIQETPPVQQALGALVVLAAPVALVVRADLVIQVNLKVPFLQAVLAALVYLDYHPFL
jgi:hypothetical protein